MEENKINAHDNAENKEKPGKDKKPLSIPILEIALITLLVISLWLYVSPNILVSKERRQASLLQANANIYTSKILAEFSQHPKAKASEIATKVAKDLNSVNKNPMNKKNPAYSLGIECLGCVVIKTDNKLNTVIIQGKDKNEAILVRTVIKPPSFVTYERDFEIENKKDAK